MNKSLLGIAAGISLARAALLPSLAFAGPIAGPCIPAGIGFSSTSASASFGNLDSTKTGEVDIFRN